MKISKYLHSCLLFEDEDFRLLVDPGKFTFAEGLVKAEDFAAVNAIIITHIHPDHFDPENIKKIAALNDPLIYTTAEVAAELEKAGVSSTVMEDDEYQVGPFHLAVFPVRHQPLLDSPIPQMFGFLLNGKVLHPVDSFEDGLLKYREPELLILPTMAPFTTELEIAAFAGRIRPKAILPVHDGFAKDFFIKQRYENYGKHFEKQGITFHPVYKPGESITL